MLVIIAITIVLALLCITGAIVFKYFFYEPKENIYYLVYLFNTPWRFIANTGDQTSGVLIFLARPLESVRRFKFRFKQLVTKQEAIDRGFKESYKIPNDEKIIVERDEWVDGYLAREFHPVVAEFLCNDGVDLFIILECAFKPIDPVLMKKGLQNWMEFAENKIVNLINTWGRNTDSKTVLGIDIDKLVKQAADDKEEDDIYIILNKEFVRFGFRLVSATIYKVANGPSSQDFINEKERVAKTSLQLQAAENQSKAEFKLGMVNVNLRKEQLEVENNAFATAADTAIKLLKQPDQTVVQSAEKWSNHKGPLMLGFGSGEERSDASIIKQSMIGNFMANTFTTGIPRKTTRRTQKGGDTNKQTQGGSDE